MTSRAEVTAKYAKAHVRASKKDTDASPTGREPVNHTSR